MKVALVHDYLAEYGGAERVVEELHRIWPDAPLFTAFVDWKRLGKHAERFRSWTVKTSWVQKFPIIKKYISPLRFLTPLVWKYFDFSGYDVVITSSGWFIPRGIRVEKPTVHICYIHHPPRNLYGYATGSNLQKYWPVRWYAHIINFFLRQYDFQTAQQVDYFIANSQETRRRVQKFYRRESIVIYPPILINFKNPNHKSSLPECFEAKQADRQNLKSKSYYLSVGRLAWAKRVDLIIEACNKLHRPLIIVGIGNEYAALKRIAGPTVKFLGSVTDEELDRLYAHATALIYTALDEDFGMVPVEAMARGTPVIGLAQGGVKETVVDGKTGVVFSKPEVSNLIKSIRQFEALSKNHIWTDACYRQARTFNTNIFRKKICSAVQKAVGGNPSLDG